MSKTFLFQAIQPSQTVPIQTIQFSISIQLVLFNPWIGPYYVRPFRARVDLGAMAMKGCFASPKALASPSNRSVSHPEHSLEGSNPSAEVQSVFSTAPADWESRFMVETAHGSRLMKGGRKNSWPRQHSSFEAPPVLSKKVSSASRQRPGWGWSSKTKVS